MVTMDYLESSKKGFLYHTAEMHGDIGNIDNTNISCLQVYFDETFAQTMYDITIDIKRKLESSFSVMQKPNLITPEEYTDPSTKKLPLYLQPRSIESLNEGLCILYGSTALNPEKISDDELEQFYRKMVARLEESGCIHHEAQLSEDNTAHPDDFYFTLRDTPHRIPRNSTQPVCTYPHTTHHLLIANIKSSTALYRLYDDLQIVANHTSSLRNDIAHRNNGLYRKRPSVWIPQIVLGTIVNGMIGCKREEKTLQKICNDVTFQDPFEKLKFYPKGIRMRGYRPAYSSKDTTTRLKMNWDFTFEHLLNAPRPGLVDLDFGEDFWK